MTLARQQLAAAATGKQAAGERRRELKLEVQLQVHAAKKVAPLKILLIKGRDSENCSQTTRFSLCKMLFAIKRFLILIRGQSEIYFTQRGCRCRVMKTKSKKKSAELNIENEKMQKTQAGSTIAKCTALKSEYLLTLFSQLSSEEKNKLQQC